MRTIDIMPFFGRCESASFDVDAMFAVSGAGAEAELPDPCAKRLAGVQRGGNGADVRGLRVVNMRTFWLRGI